MTVPASIRELEKIEPILQLDQRFIIFTNVFLTEEMKIYSDSKTSNFLGSEMGNQRIAFLNEWNMKRDHREHHYVEIQRSDYGAGVKRARYNSSLIDANVTEPGEQYEALNESYVIFITENDVLGKSLPIYHIERTVMETGEPFGDEEHIVYVNSQIKDETSLGKLMHDFACTEAKDMYYHVLADRVRYFKEDEKGVTVMCKAMEDMRNEARAEALKEKSISVAREMIKDGVLSYEKIAQYSGLTVDEVKELATKQPA